MIISLAPLRSLSNRNDAQETSKRRGWMLDVFSEELRRQRSPFGLNLMGSVQMPGMQPWGCWGVKGILSCSKGAGKPAGEQISSPRHLKGQVQSWWCYLVRSCCCLWISCLSNRVEVKVAALTGVTCVSGKRRGISLKFKAVGWGGQRDVLMEGRRSYAVWKCSCGGDTLHGLWSESSSLGE